MIVMKFGGTSVESASALERVASIVRSQLPRRPFVVVSAMGKTTNALLEIAADAAAGMHGQARTKIGALRQYHASETLPLLTNSHKHELQAILEEHFGELEENLRGVAAEGKVTPSSLDAVASFGERLSSKIAALCFREAGVPSVHLDARRMVVTDRRHTQAVPCLSETYTRIASAVSRLEPHQVAVLGGFIGATQDGVTTTLGRGGSDFTASLVGAAVDAEEIQIWTDVDGILTSDPRLVPGARPVRTITFDEAAELAYFGAKVLHPATVLPAREKNIPVRIMNSLRPEVPGTRIVAGPVLCANPLKSVACKPNITVLTVHSTRMLMAFGFLHRMFEIFDRYETSVDMLATSEVSVSLTIDNTAHLQEICRELKPFSEVTLERDQAILCVVGDNLRSTPGVAARLFGALSDVNVRMISQGASHRNLSFVIAASDLPKAAARLHHEFFTELDPAVFG